MAENEDRSTDDLSEEASPYRLEQNRQKGKVAQSRELTGILSLLMTGAVIVLWSPQMGQSLMQLMREVFTLDLVHPRSVEGHSVIQNVLYKSLRMVAIVGLPIAIAGFLGGVIGSLTQIGVIFSADPLKPDLDKINPVKGAQKFFTVRHILESIRLLFKATVVAVVAYFLLESWLKRAPGQIFQDPSHLGGFFLESGKFIFFGILAVLSIFAGIDFWIQKWEYGKSVRLNKQEQKQEHKEREGDPLIKARIRSVQREAARRRMMNAVKTADVIVTNPTHFAVAIKYDRGEMDAPRVVAKGKEFLAKRIREMAKEAGVPLVENPPLARTLYRTVKIGQAVPRVLYQAVAEVLAYVYRLKNRSI